MNAPPRFNDIRDTLVGLPHGDPWGGTSYVQHDLFTVRHELIRALSPAPVSVFEFGALYGYFLVTALDAAPSIKRVGWVDDESHTAGSNEMCHANIRSVSSVPCEIHHWRDQAIEWKTGNWDLVAVDSDHTYDGCLADLQAAHDLDPHTIMVDDWIAATHTLDIQQAVLEFLDDTGDTYRLDTYVTTNGLAVLTRKEHA